MLAARHFNSNWDIAEKGDEVIELCVNVSMCICVMYVDPSMDICVCARVGVCKGGNNLFTLFSGFFLTCP